MADKCPVDHTERERLAKKKVIVQCQEFSAKTYEMSFSIYNRCRRAEKAALLAMWILGIWQVVLTCTEPFVLIVHSYRSI